MTANLLSFNDAGFQYAWDATSISSFEKCPRYYHLKHIQGWQPDHKSVHLVFGGHYATALEHFHKKRAAGADHMEALCEIVHEALIATWETDEDGNGKPWDSLHNTKTRDTLIRSIVWYCDHFKNDPVSTITLSDGAAAVEYSFALPLGDHYLYCGHIDRLGDYGGKAYVQDQKTTGATITPRFFDGFSPDVQMPGYAWAGTIIFDIPVAGVMIDAAQIAVGFTRFERGFVHCSKQLLDEWHVETLATIENARVAHETGFYKMNRASCGNYGGCEFRKICSRAPEHRRKLLEGSFTQQPRWDPLERR